MTAVVGVAFVVASGALLWRLLPTEGKVHRLATAPFIESIIPLGIVAGFAIGAALVFAATTIR